MSEFAVRAPLAAAAFLTVVVAAASPAPASALQQDGQPDAQEADAYLWLEEVEGERALEWVETRNRETLAEFEDHPAYDSIFDEALAILNSDERIAYPSIMGEHLYNFWQDDEHERGIWRRTSWDSYLSGEPDWTVLLDMDSLSAAENEQWAFGGSTCLPPDYRRCLVRLSPGGSDAAEVREFDLETASFVEDGFFLPEAKSSVAWRDADRLLVATDFGEGSLTTSGYPRIAKLWTRGEPLSAAETIFEGESSDVSVGVGAIETADSIIHVVSHRPRFFESSLHVLTDAGLQQLDLPLDADPTLVAEQLVVYLRSEWEVEGETYTQGSVISMPYEEFLAGARDFDVVVEPDERSTVQGVRRTRDHLLVSMLDNVRGTLLRYRLEDGEWVGEEVEAPELGTINVGSTSPHMNRFFFTYSSYTQPTSLFLVEDDGSTRQIRQLPEMFAAEGIEVEQHHATSADGTRVPYFVVRDRDLPLDGTNPTLLYAYGGFQISMTPGYNATVGKSWLERGGVYVVANIRGGGEFGPEWHRAAQLENRQRAFDDFIAVAEDLIDRGITSPDHLGIQGGSNGGLLVGVAMTQRPELYDAVVIQVPLLDMRRYNQLLAGASWMAEYGDPDDPEDWAFIREYSPYHNLDEDAEYPTPLFYTTTRDDRVHPGHARKMAARMMEMGHPIEYFENTEGGHGSGVTPEQRARMYALTYTYLLDRLRD